MSDDLDGDRLFFAGCAPSNRLHIVEKPFQSDSKATAKISIALPVELKDQMKAAAKGNVINWSKVCRQRIESEIAIRKRFKDFWRD